MNIIVLSIPNIVLRQLKVQRIYYFILAFWHVQVVTHFIYKNCRVLMVHIRSKVESLKGFKIVVFRIFFQFGKKILAAKAAQ